MTWEYLAGFFDGEGSIVLAKSGKSYRTKISISNCNKEVIKNAATFLLHTYHYHKSGGPTPSYIIEICEQQQILTILYAMLPFLVVKKEKAKTMIEYIEGVGKPQGILTPDIIEARKKYAERIGENDNG